MNCVRYKAHLQCPNNYFQVEQEISRWFIHLKHLKDGSRPGQPETIVINATRNIVAVAGLIKRETRLTVKNIAHIVSISLDFDSAGKT